METSSNVWRDLSIFFPDWWEARLKFNTKEGLLMERGLGESQRLTVGDKEVLLH